MTTTPARADVLARVASRVPDLGRPVLVGIDGADGSGKTIFADELAETLRDRMPGRPVVRASVDDFHHPRAHRYAEGRTGRTVWERSFDLEALRRELLDPWRAGPGSSYHERWHDLETDAYVDQPTATVPADGVLVVDCLFAQRVELRDVWDLVVWLECPDDVRVARMVERDGRPGASDHPDQQRYLDAQAIYRAECRPRDRAGLVVDNADWGSPRIDLSALAP